MNKPANFKTCHIRKSYPQFDDTLANEAGQFADAPAPDEIVAIFAFASRGGLHARLGGLKASKITGRDGLR